MANITRDEVDKIHHILSLLVEWSGAQDDTPDDTEVLYINGQSVTLGDIKEATGTINSLAETAKVR